MVHLSPMSPTAEFDPQDYQGLVNDTSMPLAELGDCDNDGGADSGVVGTTLEPADDDIPVLHANSASAANVSSDDELQIQSDVHFFAGNHQGSHSSSSSSSAEIRLWKSAGVNLESECMPFTDNNGATTSLEMVALQKSGASRRGIEDKHFGEEDIADQSKVEIFVPANEDDAAKCNNGDEKDASGDGSSSERSTLDVSIRFVDVRSWKSRWDWPAIQACGRKLLAHLGPAYVVCIGYMDPGNWATDLAAGSSFGYTPLFVIFLSNLVAIVLQSFAVSLGAWTGKDLAQSCKMYFPWYVNYPLYVFAEAAMIATDLAEVLGSAIALKLLFGLPLLYGVLLTSVDVLVILFFFGNDRGGKSDHKISMVLQLLIVALIIVIAVCFIIEINVTQPDPVSVLEGFLPSSQLVTNSDLLYLSIGIVGATVMPHNLYLHSSLTKDPSTDESLRNVAEVRSKVKYSFVDTISALTVALFVNSAILTVSAAAFNVHGQTNIATIQDAFNLLNDTIGKPAAISFAVGLLAAGQSSTITGTLAGQVVMEGFLGFKIQPWLRRLICRVVAILPAVIVILVEGEQGINSLLIWSQVILSLQLPFAVGPLVYFTSSRSIMGERVNPIFWQVLGYLICIVIAALNVFLLTQVSTS